MGLKERRAYTRIPVNMDVTFYSGSRACNGTVMNISEKGMFISTREMYFPIESHLEVVIPFNGETLNIPVSLRRMEMSPDSCDGIGVEFNGQSEKYCEFVDCLRPAV